MTSQRQLFEMMLSGLLALLIAGMLWNVPVVPKNVASAAGGAIATTYFFSRYPWGGRPEANDQLDALFDEYLPF